MQYVKEYWAVIAAAAGVWLSRVDNEVLAKIVNLLTILAILIGLIDWAVRRICGRRKKKQQQENGLQVLEMIESTQKPFKTVQMLEDPMRTGESIGNFVDKISKEFKGEATMKKFFKWFWYNKEQLGSILYNVAILALSQVAIWTDLVAAFLPMLPPAAVIAVKVTICVLSVAFTALTVRNVCVKYGLSSLDTIDKVLAERAESAMNKLTPEQKKTLKAYIATLQQTLAQTKAEREEAEKALAEITTLFNADNSLVTNYAQLSAELNAQIAQAQTVTANVEAKIADYKAQLAGKTLEPKA